MTVRCGRVANRFALRMASATGQARLLIRPSPRRAAGVVAHGPSVIFTTSLRWHDRAGATIGPPTPARAYARAAPVARSNERDGGDHDAATAQSDLWLLSLARGTTSRVTSDPSSDWFPVWSHDGSGVFFGSPRVGSTTIFQKAGVSPEVVFADSLLVGSVATYPNDVSQDGAIAALSVDHESWLRSRRDSALGRSQAERVCQRPVQRSAGSLLAKPPVDRIRVG